MRERFEQRLFRIFAQAGYSPVQLLTITPEEMVEIPGITVPNIRAVLCVQNKVLADRNKAFEYGGFHFIPERRFTAEENSFLAISRRQRLDKELGFCKPGYAYKSKYPYSHESFYAASPDKECDLFRCVENGKLYLPCTNDLQEYMEQPKKERNRTHER